MGKKMKLPFPFRITETASSWPWPSCGSPKTLSFRAGGDVFMNSNTAMVVVETPQPHLGGGATESRRLSKAVDSSGDGLESMIRGLRSERLFFEPGETRSIMKEAKADGFPFKETVVVAMESGDPFEDFRRSMEEMVEAHGLKDWECLEELLSWYLRVNGKSNYGYIVGAFVDLLIHLAFDYSTSSISFDGDNDHDHDHHSNTISHSPTHPLSFSSSTSSYSLCLSSLEAEDEIQKTPGNCSSSSSYV